MSRECCGRKNGKAAITLMCSEASLSECCAALQGCGSETMGGESSRSR